MDLNEKLAARRRELAIEAEKTTRIEAARRKEAAIEAEKAMKEKKAAVDAEVAKRLAEKGIPQPVSTLPPTRPQEISTDLVDAEVKKAIRKAATERLTLGEKTTFGVLFVMGILSFFLAWWLGIFFIGWAFVYSARKTDQYETQIIDEGKAKLDNESIEMAPKYSGATTTEL